MPRSVHFCFPVYLFHFVLFLVISLVESSAWKLITAVSEISNHNFFMVYIFNYYMAVSQSRFSHTDLLLGYVIRAN